MTRLYADLDYVHSFYEGNSRTLREFTRSLAQDAGYELNWAPTGVEAADRNRLYVARDIAVLERAFPGLTPQRGMETNDRAEYETSLALSALRRVAGASLEAIIREGLAPLSPPERNAALADPDVSPPRPRGVATNALAALARYGAGRGTDGTLEHTAISERSHQPSGPAPNQAQPTADQSLSPLAGGLKPARSAPEPGP